MHDDARIGQLGDSPIRKVTGPLAGSARQQDHVSRLECLVQSMTQLIQVVASDGKSPCDAAKFADRVREYLGVGVIDTSRPHRLARRDDLVTGRKDGHDRATPDGDLRDSHGGEHAGVPAGQQVTGSQHRFARRDVGAGEGHVGTARNRTGDDERRVPHVGMLDHYHRIRAARDHAAGGDGYCRP